MSNLAVTIRRALPGQSSRLTQIAHAAKSYWGYPAHWIELWHDQLTISPAYIEAHEVWIAEADGGILGFCALTQEGARVNLEHLWVMPVSIGQGIGGALFRHAVERALALGAECMEIESDPNAEGFYARMGAQVVGEVAYVLDGQRRCLPLMELALTMGEPTLS